RLAPDILAEFGELPSTYDVAGRRTDLLRVRAAAGASAEGGDCVAVGALAEDRRPGRCDWAGSGPQKCRDDSSVVFWGRASRVAVCHSRRARRGLRPCEPGC